MSTNYKALAEKYQHEAEAYAIHYQDEIKSLKALMVMSGVLCSMESELIQYEIKQGKTERGQAALERIEILKSIYDDLSGINERNRRMKILMADNNARMMQMSEELEALRKSKSDLIEFEKD